VPLIELIYYNNNWYVLDIQFLTTATVLLVRPLIADQPNYQQPSAIIKQPWNTVWRETKVHRYLDKLCRNACIMIIRVIENSIVKVLWVLKGVSKHSCFLVKRGQNLKYIYLHTIYCLLSFDLNNFNMNFGIWFYS
jgi:hypothetical protein